MVRVVGIEPGTPLGRGLSSHPMEEKIDLHPNSQFGAVPAPAPFGYRIAIAKVAKVTDRNLA